MCAGDLGEDVLEIGGPDEGFGVVVVCGDVVIDSLLQDLDVAEAAASNALGGDVAEPAFDHVQPRT